jgi:hypothetical protein
MLNCHAINHSDLKDLFKDTNTDKEVVQGMTVIAVNIKGINLVFTI